MYSGIVFDYLAMATIRLTVLNSIKESDGRLPILVCISQKSKRAYIKTEFLINDIAEFDNGKVVYRKDANTMNKRIEFVFSQFKKKYDNIENKEWLTALQIKQVIISKKKPTHISFIEFWKSRISEFKEEGRNSYAKMNEETIRIFTKAESDIPISAINTLLIEHFKKWMERKGYSNGNIGLRLTHLKARINELIKNGVLKTEIHPFVYTKIPTAEPKECDLTIDEFRKIQNTEVEGKRINLAKDMILLSFYLCGINLKDLLSINLNGDTITYERTKTIHSKTGKGNITIPIHNNAKPIINKYINKKGVLDLGYSYTYSNLQKYINLCIKKLKEHLDIKQTLCFYSARKTFAQFASELGIPDGVIDYCLGHSDKNKGIIRYYTKVRQKQAEIAINRVIDYVNNPDKYKDYIEMRADVMMMKG